MSKTKQDAAPLTVRSNGGLGTELGFVAAFFAELQTKQEPIGSDFENVLYENLWDLYES